MKSQMRKALGRARWGRPVDGVLEGCRDCREVSQGRWVSKELSLLVLGDIWGKTDCSSDSQNAFFPWTQGTVSLWSARMVYGLWWDDCYVGWGALGDCRIHCCRGRTVCISSCIFQFRKEVRRSFTRGWGQWENWDKFKAWIWITLKDDLKE